MIHYSDLTPILLENGFTGITNRYPEGSVKKAFRYKRKYEILIDEPYIRLLSGCHKKAEWTSYISEDQLASLFSFLRLSYYKQNKFDFRTLSGSPQNFTVNFM